MSHKAETLEWTFPLPRTHTGILIGNARMGVMIWGEGRTLRVTLGRADTWDHRGGMPWTDKQNFADIRRLLEAGDEKGLRAIFVTQTENKPGQPRRPCIIPLGRVDLDLGEGAELRSGSLHYQDGRVEIRYTHGGQQNTITCLLDMASDALALRLPLTARITTTNRPAWETLDGALQNISFETPVPVADKSGNGWIQPFPVDPAVGVLHRLGKDNTLWIATARGATVEACQSNTAAVLGEAMGKGYSALYGETAAWWDAYWRETPDVELPNPALQMLYRYGMYKFAGLTNPAGVAATLQGPWVEEYQLPPWSNDYHFNINVQMCYWPSFRGNHLAHLRPLFDLVFQWEDTLRDIARKFAGVTDGRMLPHAVDDRCTCMGGFWTGSIDHACTAWVAQMMYDYARFMPDPVFLREKAFPFMKGTMDVFLAMVEERDGRYVLPISVSPEYNGANMNAWGKNASFQLAALRRLAENLIDAAKLLGETLRPEWQEVLDKAPHATLSTEEAPQIQLWEGQPLAESHRHHSHLGGLYPFDSINQDDPAWLPVISRSIDHWIKKGMGAWSGWCMPWAAILHARVGNGRMAELILETWKKVFTNIGHGTLHDVDFRGLSLLGATSMENPRRPHPEIMQMDAGMGAVGAILEMLVHTRRGVLHVLDGIPDTWNNCRFRGIRAEGGILVDGVLERGRIAEIRLNATADATLRLSAPAASGTRIRIEAKNGQSTETILHTAILELALTAGQIAVVTPA